METYLHKFHRYNGYIYVYRDTWIKKNVIYYLQVNFYVLAIHNKFFSPLSDLARHSLMYLIFQIHKN